MRFSACVWLFMAFIAVSSCAPVIAPRGTESDRPTLLDDAFVTRDGLRLPVRRWKAAKTHAVVVALHGMSDYSNAFDMPATFWAQNGITTLAYDQRGFGRSPNPGLWPGDTVLRADLSDFIDSARQEFPDTPVFVLGESMGGAVVLSALASVSPPSVDGAILVAPAVWSREDMPLSYRVALWTAAHTFPAMKLSGRGLKIWPSDNVPMLRKLARDPLFQHATRADAVYGLVNLMDKGRRAASDLENAPPILWVYGKNDQVIPPASTRATLKLLNAPHADIRCYPNGYHMLLRDLEGPNVWRDVLVWMDSEARSGRERPSSEVSAQLKIDEERGREHSHALGAQGQPAELGSSGPDRCLDSPNKSEVVAQ